MPEALSFPRILPIGAVLFHLLFLFAAIPIEAAILHRWLKFDKKTSTFYAIAINLFSSVIGWMIFFIIEPVLPSSVRTELISYVFFNSFKSPGSHSLLIFTAFLIFFMTFLIKYFLLKVMLISLDDLGKKVEPSEVSDRRRWTHNRAFKLQNTNLVTTTLIANSLSYTAITLIMFIRNFK